MYIRYELFGRFRSINRSQSLYTKWGQSRSLKNVTLFIRDTCAIQDLAIFYHLRRNRENA